MKADRIGYRSNCNNYLQIWLQLWQIRQEHGADLAFEAVALGGKFGNFFADYNANTGGLSCGSGIKPASQLEILAVETIAPFINKLKIPSVQAMG